MTRIIPERQNGWMARDMKHTTPPNPMNDSNLSDLHSLLSLSRGWILLIIACSAGAIILMTLFPFSEAPVESASPFAPYAGVMPGSSRAEALNAGFVCDDRQPDYCSRRVNDTYFTSISITCAENRVAQTQFMIRDGALRIGDLPYFARQPDVRFSRHAVRFSWETVSASAQVDSGRFSYFTPLTSITFTVSPLPAAVVAAL
jgi:hypothetical protein